MLSGCSTGTIHPGFFERGLASWYGPGFHGKKTASGEKFNMYALTAAHKSLPLGTIVRVKSIGSGKEVTVRINDRGPFTPGRVIDLSKAAAQKIGMIGRGMDKVDLFVVKHAVRQARHKAHRKVRRTARL
jgi:rare lipoprotein A